MKNIIFLDIGGVLNCELFYRSTQFDDYKEAKKRLRKEVKAGDIDSMDYYSSQICRERVGWLNKLCEDTDSKIVVSSTWRMGKSVEQLQEMFNYCGGTFEVISVTGTCACRNRGCEINAWLLHNCMPLFGVHASDFYRYAIIDDDSDMLYGQRFNFFQTDTYSGLTPNVCYRIKRFLNHVTF